MKVKRVIETGTRENPHGVDVRTIYDTENAQIMHITLKPGESLKKHVTPVDAIFYVLEGTATVEIGDENVSVERDSIVDSPKNIPHAIRNESGGLLRVLVAKVPRQTSPTKIVAGN